MNVCAQLLEPVAPQLDPTLVNVSDDVLAVSAAGAVLGGAVGTGVAVGAAVGSGVGDGVAPGGAVTAGVDEGFAVSTAFLLVPSQPPVPNARTAATTPASDFTFKGMWARFRSGRLHVGEHVRIAASTLDGSPAAHGRIVGTSLLLERARGKRSEGKRVGKNEFEMQLTVSAPRSNVGRHVFGAAVLASGLITLVWHDYRDFDQLRYVLNASDGPVFVYAVAAAQIAGGAAMQFRRTAKTGAVILGAVYLVFAFLCVPRILAAPRIYNSWGNFFEPFSLVTGAALVYARLSSAWAPATRDRIGRILLGLCVASFALEQAFYLDNTASLVPKWIPPSPMFWAVATTIAFALAAVALLTNRMALLATRLLTMMIVSFGLLVWVPLLLSHPHSHTNWSEAALTFAIAGAAWILADLLGEARARHAEVQASPASSP